MRQVTEVLTCDVCGKTKVTQHVHIGVETKLERADLLNTGHEANEIYEIRPTQHVCGKCADSVSAVASKRVADIRKKEAGNA